MVANPMKQWLMQWQRSPALLFYLIFLLVVSVAPVCCAAIGTQDSQTAAGRIADSPLNASYQIEGQWITLNNGRAQQPAAPGSASTIRTEVVGRWVSGDLEGDGDRDAVMILVHAPGGSGTFYYLTAALARGDDYCGLNAVPLGDRIVLRDIAVTDSLIEVRYRHRASHEPMTAPPSIEGRLVVVLDNGKLVPIRAPSTGEQIVAGWVTIGHEVRIFRPCGQEVDYWLAGDSPAMGKIVAGYEDAAGGLGPYSPVFMVLSGMVVDKPREGFGADFKGAFRAREVWATRPEGYCHQKKKR
jgi:hypothetical protein